MAAITFPTISIRSDYDPAAGTNYVGPWEDPNGKEWNWNGALERWQPYLPALRITESETEPSDRTTVWGKPSTGEFSWYSVTNEAWMAVNVTGGGTTLTAYSDIEALSGYPTSFPTTPADITIADTETATEALADTDVFFFRDVSGTAANKTSALSRIWTYILSKFAATPLPVNSGGTGGTDASTARTNLGLGTTDTFTVGGVTGGPAAGGYFYIRHANDADVRIQFYNLGNDTSWGFYDARAVGVFAILGSNGAYPGGIAQMRSNGVLGWTGGNIFGSQDTGISRGAAGTVCIGTGEAGSTAGKLRQTTSTTSDPTTTEYPASTDWGIHKNTASGDVFLAYNDGGTIKKVVLT